MNKSTQIIAQPNSDLMKSMQVAIKENSDPAVIQNMIELIKFSDERAARSEFNTAFTLAQSEFPTVIAHKMGHQSPYAPYEDIVQAIKEPLKKYGLSFRHKQEKVEGNNVKITCILSHAGGYSEETYMIAPPDNSGKKNAIQAIGSTDSYLKRYTLTAITGIATSENIDTDGAYNGSKPEYITPDQIETMKDNVAILEKLGIKESFMQWLGNAMNTNVVNKIKASDFELVQTAIYNAIQREEKK